MKTVKVTREYYAVGSYGDRREFAEMGEAVQYCYKRLIDGNYHSLTIERITEYAQPEGEETFLSVFLKPQVVSSVTIQGPASLYADPRLSRYHPVNGWVVPETIDVEDND